MQRRRRTCHFHISYCCRRMQSYWTNYQSRQDHKDYFRTFNWRRMGKVCWGYRNDTAWKKFQRAVVDGQSQFLHSHVPSARQLWDYKKISMLILNCPLHFVVPQSPTKLPKNLYSGKSSPFTHKIHRVGSNRVALGPNDSGKFHIDTWKRKCWKHKT